MLHAGTLEHAVKSLARRRSIPYSSTKLHKAYNGGDLRGWILWICGNFSQELLRSLICPDWKNKSVEAGILDKLSEEADLILASHHESTSSCLRDSQNGDDGQKSFPVQLSYDYFHLELEQGIGWKRSSNKQGVDIIRIIPTEFTFSSPLTSISLPTFSSSTRRLLGPSLLYQCKSFQRTPKLKKFVSCSESSYCTRACQFCCCFLWAFSISSSHNIVLNVGW